MVQVIHFWINVTSGSGTRSYVPFEAVPKAQLSAAAGATPIAAAGTLRNLRVRTIGGVTLGANATISLFVNGSVSALSDILSTSVAEFTDTSDVAVSAGDTVELRIVTGVSTGAFTIMGSVDFEASDANTSIAAFGDAQDVLTSVGDQDALLNGGNWESNADYYSLVGTDGTITGYYWKVNVAPGAGTSRTMALYKNGTIQDGSGGTPDTRVTISDTATSNSGSFALAVVAGDKVHIAQSAVSGSPASSRAMGTCKFVSTFAGRWNGCLTSGTGPQTTETPPAYFRPLGNQVLATWAGTTETDREMRNGPTSCWLSRMRVDSNDAPGTGGDAWVFTLRKNQGDTIQSGTLTDSAVAAGPDPSAGVELTSGDTFAIRWEELVTPGNSTGIRMAWQFSETDPGEGTESGGGALPNYIWHYRQQRMM